MFHNGSLQYNSSVYSSYSGNIGISKCMIIPHIGSEERRVVCYQASALATSSSWTWTFFLFWFSYGDYSFGRALKTTVGRGEGEAAGLKDRIK